MELQKQVCSLELSKRLKELGVKQESLFKINKWGEVAREFYYGGGGRVGAKEPEIYSAFTVAELGEMLRNSGITTEEIIYGYGRIYVYISDEYKEQYKITEKELWFESSDGNGETEADARAKMLIYLIEKNLI